MKRSKILCTIGPASANHDTLVSMVDAGMDAVRLNFSHGTWDDHRRAVELVRRVAAETGRPLPVLQDLQGPKIRVGTLPAEGVELVQGSTVVLVPGDTLGTGGEIPVTYEALARELGRGHRVLMDDGLLELEVTEVSGERVVCRVITGGRLTSHKGVNMPAAGLSVPSLTPKDRRDLEAGLDMGVDMVALSFVRSPADVLELRRVMEGLGAGDTPIIAKIEKPQAVEHLPGIIEVAEGIMVARGDLGVELPPQRVPLLQRHMVQDANAAGKLVIIATQMLDSMVHNPRPTRAEVTDVATAVMQGTDATMLSNETAVGAYPVEAVRMMATIIEEVEGGLREFEAPPEPALIQGIARCASVVGRAAVQAATDVDAACIAVFTGSGRTASLVSDYRPSQPILAFTPRVEVYRRMGLLWGVIPVLVDDRPMDLDRARALARERALELPGVEPGASMVMTLSQPLGFDRQTNLLWMQQI